MMPQSVVSSRVPLMPRWAEFLAGSIAQKSGRELRATGIGVMKNRLTRNLLGLVLLVGSCGERTPFSSNRTLNPSRKKDSVLLSSPILGFLSEKRVIVDTTRSLLNDDNESRSGRSCDPHPVRWWGHPGKTGDGVGSDSPGRSLPTFRLIP